MILDTHFVDFTTCLFTSDHPLVGFTTCFWTSARPSINITTCFATSDRPSVDLTTCFWTSSRPVINFSTCFTTLDSENRALARVLATQLRSRSCFGRATYVFTRNCWGRVDIGHFVGFVRIVVFLLKYESKRTFEAPELATK